MAGEGGMELPDALFRAAVQDAGQLMVVMDDTGSIVWANETFRTIGYEPAELVGRLPLEFVHPDEVERAILALASLDSPNATDPGSYKLLRGDGSYDTFDSAAAPFTFDGNSYYLFSFRLNPFLESQTNMLAGLAADQPAHVALSTLADGLSRLQQRVQVGIALDVDGERVVVGPLPPALIGVTDGMQDTSTGTPWGRAIDLATAVETEPVDAFDPEVVALARSSALERVTIFPVPDPGSKLPALFAIWFGDDTSENPAKSVTYNYGRAPRDLVQLALERRAERERLEHLALHDPLTGLANRARFRDALRWSLRPGPADAPPRPIAVVYLDLDDFKPINDRCGHDAGDRVLQALADRFREAAGGHLVARIGGDEFAVLCTELEGVDEVESLVRRLIEVASDELPVETGVRVGASAGIAYAGDATSADADRLLLLADESLYGVKRDRKGGFACAIVD